MEKELTDEQMEQDYLKVSFALGGSIKDAVNLLLENKEKGKLVYGKFNGVTLYSDTVTMDEAHQEIIGMTKAEFDKYLSGLKEHGNRHA